MLTRFSMSASILPCWGYSDQRELRRGARLRTGVICLRRRISFERMFRMGLFASGMWERSPGAERVSSRPK